MTADSTPDIEIIDPRMREVADPAAELIGLCDGFRFVEGPAWWPAVGGLIFSDIPSDAMHLWTEADGCSDFRRPSRKSNGNTIDGEGRLVTCEHGSRTVTRTTSDGRVETLCSHYRGRRLNSPNDLVVKRDGTIWFTDPTYGIQPEEKEQGANHVFRLDPGADEPVALVDDFSMPNGLCFSPDERLLYIADSDKAIHHVRRFEVRDDNTLAGGEIFIILQPGLPDGMRIDETGRLFCTAADGVHVYEPGGTLIGKIRTPKVTANCTFGGPDGRTLFLTSTDSVWAIHLKVGGAG